MNKKKILSIVLLAVAVVILGVGTVMIINLLQTPEDLVLNNMQIVLPDTPTEIEKTAAQELNSYFGKITGTELTVVTEGQAEVLSGIYIGNTQFATANKVTYPEAKFEEGWAIKAVNGNLVLTGGAGRGVLYAVFHLLEDYMGVRWWTYWEEYVPSIAEVRIAGNLNVSGKPALVWRDIHGGKTSAGQINLFCVRNRLNGDTANAPAEYGGEEAFGLPAHVHTFNRYITIDDYNTNPEWFAYVNGGRISNAQLCMTNQDLVEEMANRVINSIEQSYAIADAAGTKRPLLYDLSPNDQDGHCACTECSLARQEKGLSGVLLTFVNQVAEKVGEVHPEVYIETLAYMAYLDVPLDDTKPADNVIIRMTLSARDVMHGLEHEYNDRIREQIEKWVSITKEGQLYIWDYVVFYNNPGVTPTVMDYSENFKVLSELGAAGYFGEQEDPIMTDFWDMKFWVNAKLMENPNLDEDTLINDFLNGYYGAAGPYLREYLDLLHGKSSASLVALSYGVPTLASRWITLDDMIRAQELIEQAIAAVGDDDVLLRRVRQCRNALDRAFLERYEIHAEQAQKSGIELPYTEIEICQRIVDVLEEQILWRGSYDYTAEDYLNRYKTMLYKLLG